MKEKKLDKVTPKKITHIKGKTKMEKKNEESLNLLKSIKGMFG